MSRFITYDTKGLEAYLTHLKSLTYNEMNNGASSIVRQVANDIKIDYLSVTPRRQSEGRSGKYGATAGNLQRSLRVFKKRQRNAFIIEYSIGFKKHSYGELTKKRGKGSKVIDGYYDFMVNEGVAGRNRGRSNNQSSRGFVERGRVKANRTIKSEVSERAVNFIQQKLQKALDQNGKG